MRMRLHWLLLAAALTTGACGSGTTSPSGPGTGGGGGGAAGTVTVGNIFFRSGHNGTTNPAVDTVAAGTTVTWTWTGTGGTSHSVLSTGSPSFTSSPTQSGDGKTYTFTFVTPGTYQYDCVVHGTAMSGTIVVQ
ncbi:MAG: plastocyanin/azurin family copper-binding protein [Gemmatimonadales bacterium]